MTVGGLAGLRPILSGALHSHSSTPSSFIGSIVRVRCNPRLARQCGRLRRLLHNDRSVRRITLPAFKSFVPDDLRTSGRPSRESPGNQVDK